VKFTNNQRWQNVYVHAWNAGGDLTSWPGIQMTNIGDNGMNEGVNNFEAKIPEGATGIVFSAGNDSAKTTDITDLNHEGWYLNGNRDGGAFIAVPWDGGNQQNNGKMILFTCSIWDTVYLYSWNDAGNESSGAWPGSQMTETQTNSWNEKQYKIYIPNDASHIVLSNGQGDQTVDIDNLNVTGYYITGQADGKRTVASW
ncbi:MAG: starch-binding protein, partial [Ruminococcus sp.]|nr:starch-binding protein [Ruminococcus sp.]